MIVDESGSIGLYNYGLVKTFLNHVLSKFTVSEYGVHFGVIKYASTPTIVFGLDSYMNVSEMQQVISDMSYSQGGTMTGAAMKLARKSV